MRQLSRLVAAGVDYIPRATWLSSTPRALQSAWSVLIQVYVVCERWDILTF